MANKPPIILLLLLLLFNLKNWEAPTFFFNFWCRHFQSTLPISTVTYRISAILAMLSLLFGRDGTLSGWKWVKVKPTFKEADDNAQVTHFSHHQFIKQVKASTLNSLKSIDNPINISVKCFCIIFFWSINILENTFSLRKNFLLFFHKAYQSYN